MRSFAAIAVAAFAIAAMFIMVISATETGAARSSAIGDIHMSLPPGVSYIDLPE